MALMQANKHLKTLSVVEGLLSQEVQDKLNKIAALETQQASILNTMSTDSERVAAFNSLTTAFEAADATLEGALTTLVNTATAAVASEETRALAAEAALQTAVDNAISGYQTAIANVTTAYTAAIASEATDRAAGDAALQAAIDGVASDLSDLAVRVTAAEASIVTLQADVITAQAAADAAQLSADNAAAAGVVNATAISTESTARGDADAVLQGQIDALSAGVYMQRGSLVGTVDDVNTAFTLPTDCDTAKLVIITLDGRELDETDGVTVSGSNVSFTSAPNLGSSVKAKYYPN